MDVASVYYLGVTLLLFLIFAALVARTYSKKRHAQGEEPKFRMMNDDYPHKESKGGRDVRRK